MGKKDVCAEHGAIPAAEADAKPAPLTRTQRWRRNIRWKIETARLRVGSWIAGVYLDER